MVDDPVDRQAHAVDGDRTLVSQEASQLERCVQSQQPRFTDRLENAHLADAVDMTADQVTTEPVVGAQGFLEVDRATRRGQPRRARQALGRYVDAEGRGVAVEGRDCHASTVDGDAVAERHVLEVARWRGDAESLAVLCIAAERAHVGYPADAGDDACEHGVDCLRRSRRPFSQRPASPAGAGQSRRGRSGGSEARSRRRVTSAGRARRGRVRLRSAAAPRTRGTRRPDRRAPAIR